MTPLDPANQFKLRKWFDEKCRLGPCPACNQSRWNADEMIGSLRLGNGGDVNIANAGIAAFVPLVCLNCGYTMLFSATIMGLAPKADAPPRTDNGQK